MKFNIEELKKSHPSIDDMINLRETVWINRRKLPEAEAETTTSFTMEDIFDARDRLERFAPYLAKVFPETGESHGIIESELREIPHMKNLLEKEYSVKIPGRLCLKMDSHLPISGSIKARGGIYEVLKTAEDIALANGMITYDDDYTKFASDEMRELLSKYSIAVGSTGNLGLSIGIMSAQLGFRVAVHMSADARQWKKDLLRSKGVTVVEYDSDYSVAVKEGREKAKDDPFCHFVDDENSKTLFLGYSVAALRLKDQLETEGITVDNDHPMFVYLPCGVGGAPGGVAFGLKMVFGDSVHCFFAEPTHSCCMTLGLATGLNSTISVQDVGIDNKTIADGLAVGRASGFVGTVIGPFISGSYTVEDGRMNALLYQLADSEQIYLEPSALAGMLGPVLASKNPDFLSYIERQNITGKEENILHIAWATGGNMVPAEDMQVFVEEGRTEAASGKWRS